MARDMLLSCGTRTHIHHPPRQAQAKNTRPFSFVAARREDPSPTSACRCKRLDAAPDIITAERASPASHTVSEHVKPPSTDHDQIQTVFIAETLLPTRQGKFRLRGYKHSVDGGTTFTEPTAIISGGVEGAENVTVRVHDACFTSEVLGSLKCDCAEQLQLAMQTIQRSPPGMIIYLQQEGRGIGLANKIAAYALQEKGLDTVDANRALGLPDDCREYTSVRNILNDLGVKSINLMTNNPRKIAVLANLGVKISERVPCVVEAGSYNKGYLETKAQKMDHLLDGSWCYWNHEGEPVQPSSSSTGSMDAPIPTQRHISSSGMAEGATRPANVMNTVAYSTVNRGNTMNTDSISPS